MEADGVTPVWQRRSPQEFDFLQDFRKPKQRNDISQAYHCSTKLERLPHNQGNARAVGDAAMLQAALLGRTSAARRTVLEDYSGWHVIGFRWTPLGISITGAFRTPTSPEDKPIYGRLEEANLPDRMLVDDVRVWSGMSGWPMRMSAPNTPACPPS